MPCREYSRKSVSRQLSVSVSLLSDQKPEMYLWTTWSAFDGSSSNRSRFICFQLLWGPVRKSMDWRRLPDYNLENNRKI